MFESSHNYVFVHEDVPNSIPFEKITPADITSENLILEILIKFLEIEMEMNKKNFFSTDLNTDNYLLVLPKQYPKQKLELYLVSAKNIQILPKQSSQDSFLSLEKANSFTSVPGSSKITKVFFERLLEIAYVLYQEFFSNKRVTLDSLDIISQPIQPGK